MWVGGCATPPPAVTYEPEVTYLTLSNSQLLIAVEICIVALNAQRYMDVLSLHRGQALDEALAPGAELNHRHNFFLSHNAFPFKGWQLEDNSL